MKKQYYERGENDFISILASQGHTTATYMKPSVQNKLLVPFERHCREPDELTFLDNIHEWFLALSTSEMV